MIEVVLYLLLSIGGQPIVAEFPEKFPSMKECDAKGAELVTDPVSPYVAWACEKSDEQPV